MSHPTIRLESLWNNPDKTLPLDMCMNPKGILVDDHGSFGSVDCSQAELMVLRWIPHAKLLHTPSSLLSDDNDFVFPYLHITDIVEESSESTSQGYPIFTVVGLNKYSPGGTTALVTTTVSAPVETDTPVIAHVFIPDATQASAEDVQPENLAKDNTSCGPEDSFSYVTSGGLRCPNSRPRLHSFFGGRRSAPSRNQASLSYRSLCQMFLGLLSPVGSSA
jgi:hypothetical protein